MHGIIIAIAITLNRFASVTMRSYMQIFIIQGFTTDVPDQVIVVPLGNYPENDTYRFKREIRKELWLQHVANGHRYPQSYIRVKPVPISSFRNC